LLIVTIVTAVVGAPLFYVTDKYLQTANPFIGIPMIILGLVLIGVGLYIRYSRSVPKIGGLPQMKLKNYVMVGIAQGIAALPGVSRSGMTVSTMLVMGVKPEQAFRLSYLAYIPASIGAFAVSVLLSPENVKTSVQAVQPTGIIVAIITATIAGLITISYLLRVAKTSRIWVLDIVLGLIALSIGIIVSIFASQLVGISLT